jgi:prepilin-type N-terminal cleavage/methylation domain-containing protein
MRTRPRRKQPRGGFGLIELMVVIVIIIIISGFYMGVIGKKSPGEKSMPGKAMEKAVDTVCQSNIRQLRMNISMETMGEESAPKSLKAAAEGLGAAYTKCTTSGESYDYSSADGSVRCLTEGHEEY